MNVMVASRVLSWMASPVGGIQGRTRQLPTFDPVRNLDDEEIITEYLYIAVCC